MSTTETTERQEARATLQTNITCSNCGDDFVEEGDAADDKVECPWCNAKLIVRRTA
jgi:DNA-directed RNA polymerase subunit RPC12/RpoP